MRIGIDVMGGDFIPEAPIGGLKSVLPLLEKSVQLVLLGQQPVVEEELRRQGLNPSNFEIIHTPQVIGMDEHPAKAITHKPDSSIGIGFQLHKEGKLDAFISAGNTGAVMVGAVLKLGNINGVSRPTVGALFPTQQGKFSFLCDVGANTDCKPEQLVQFGLLGALFMREVMQVQAPRVALINIGEEASKGNQTAQQANQLMQQTARFNFIGNAEGRDLHLDVADVYVVDGFTGNILLKFGESFYPIMKQLAPQDKEVEKYNFEYIGGLPMLGIKGNVMVGHGISGPLAFHNMILRTVEIVNSGLVGKIERSMEAE